MRKKKAYSFWRLTSPPIVESAVPGSSLVEERGTSGEAPLPGPKSNARTARSNIGCPGSPTRSHQDTKPQGTVGTGTVENEGGARLDALDVLEGTREETGNAHNNNKHEVMESDEEKPIIMCGKRLYSDWTGNWSTLIRNPIPQVAQLTH